MSAGGERRLCGFADVDRTIIKHDDNGLDRQAPGLRAVEVIKHLQDGR